MDTAPLLELDQFFCPDGESFYFPLDASSKLRVAFWNLESNYSIMNRIGKSIN